MPTLGLGLGCFAGGTGLALFAAVLSPPNEGLLTCAPARGRAMGVGLLGGGDKMCRGAAGVVPTLNKPLCASSSSSSPRHCSLPSSLRLGLGSSKLVSPSGSVSSTTGSGVLPFDFPSPVSYDSERRLVFSSLQVGGGSVTAVVFVGLDSSVSLSIRLSTPLRPLPLHLRSPSGVRREDARDEVDSNEGDNVNSAVWTFIRVDELPGPFSVNPVPAVEPSLMP